MPTTAEHPQTGTAIVAPGAGAQRTRGEQRRRQILAAAVQVLERNGSQGMSMQAVAHEASVSVGLIYKHCGNKEVLVKEVVLEVLRGVRDRIPAAVEAAGTDPVEQVAAGFAACCRVIDDHREAAMLTYRESRHFGPEARELARQLETSTARPLLRAVQQACRDGIFRDVDPALFADDLLVTAHAWALKHWYFETRYTIDGYIAAQTDLLLHGVLAPEHTGSYPHLTRR